MVAIVITNACSDDGGAVVCPSVSRLVPIVANSRDICEGFALWCKGCVGESRGVCGLAGLLTGGSFGDLGGHGSCFGLDVGFIMLADSGRGDGGVIVCPRVSRLVPIVADSRDIREGLALCCESFIGEGSGVSGFTGFFAGRGFGDRAGHGSRLGFDMVAIVLTNACSGDGGVVVCPSVSRLVPIVADSRDVRKRLALCCESFIGEGSRVDGFTGFFAGRGFGDRAGHGSRFGFDVAVIVLADTDSSNGGVVVCPHISRLVPIVADSRDVRKSLGLRCKSLISESRGVGGFTGFFAGSGLGDCSGYGCRLGFDVSLVVLADAGSGYGRVILSPGIGGVMPIVFKRRHSLLRCGDITADCTLRSLGEPGFCTGWCNRGQNGIGMQFACCPVDKDFLERMELVGCTAAAARMIGYRTGKGQGRYPDTHCVRQNDVGKSSAAVKSIASGVSYTLQGGGQRYFRETCTAAEHTVVQRCDFRDNDGAKRCACKSVFVDGIQLCREEDRC